MIYLPYEGWSNARMILYNRTMELAQRVEKMNQVELFLNQEEIVKRVKSIAHSIKDFCFAVDEVVNFTEKEFPSEREKLIKYIKDVQK